MLYYEIMSLSAILANLEVRKESVINYISSVIESVLVNDFVGCAEEVNDDYPIDITVCFNNGSAYNYRIPWGVFEKFHNDSQESVGKAYHKHIKGKYASDKVQ